MILAGGHLDVVHLLLFAASALFAWSMGSHYAGAVVGTAYGAGLLSRRAALLLAATGALLGSVLGGGPVIDTYAHGLVAGAAPRDVAAGLLAASLVTTASTYFRLPTSTIQIYAFSVLGVAWSAGLPIRAAGYGGIVLAWIAAPALALVIGWIAARAGFARWARLQSVLRSAVIAVAAYASFTLGTNDISNAAAGLVQSGALGARAAAAWGGVFMAVGMLTWGRGLLERVGRGIVAVDVPLAATAQLSQALTLSLVNAAGFNASINQTLVGGLAGAGYGTRGQGVDRAVLMNIVRNWLLSPVLGFATAVLFRWGLAGLPGASA